MSRLIVVGSSTGGPPILLDILSMLPAPLPCPLVIAHHILPGFEEGLALWLSKTGHTIVVARQALVLQSGTVYLAPGDQHIAVSGERLVPCAPTGESFVPSVDVLFRSVAESVRFATIAVLLTGMGRDGAAGLLAVRDAGGETITQRADTCAVDGMPGEARRLGAAAHDLPPADIARFLCENSEKTQPVSSREKLLRLINAR